MYCIPNWVAAVFPVTGRLLAWHSLPTADSGLPFSSLEEECLSWTLLAPGILCQVPPPLAPLGAWGSPSLGACLMPTMELQLVVAWLPASTRPISIGVLRTQFNLVSTIFQPTPSAFPSPVLGELASDCHVTRVAG